MGKNGRNSIVKRWHHLLMLAYRVNLLSLPTSRIQAWWMRISAAGLSFSTLKAPTQAIRYEHILSFYHITTCLLSYLEHPSSTLCYNSVEEEVSSEADHGLMISIKVSHFFFQVPFPMGVNVRSRPGRARASTQEEGNQDSPPSLADKENFVGENSSSVSVMGESE